MREGWNLFGLCAAALLLLCQIYRCSSLNLEGLALLEFRSGVEIDPHGAFENWDPDDEDPCNWAGVHCIDGKVETLHLMELSLGGVLAPELGKLSHLRALVLHRNKFTGVIPKEIGGLNMLELLDLRGNNLSGTIPRELGEMLSLKCLLLCDNKFEGGTPSWMEKLDMISDLGYNSDLSCEMGCEIGCTNRKVGQCIWQRGLQQLKDGSLVIPLKGQILCYLDMQPLFKFIRDSSHDHGEKHGDNLLINFVEPCSTQNAYDVNTVRRQLLQEDSNLAAIPVSITPPQEVAAVPSVGSGSFPAIPSSKDRTDGKQQASLPTTPTNPPNSSPSLQTHNTSVADGNLGTWVYILLAVGAFLLILDAIMLLACRQRRGGAIGPWKTGLSGQLQKAFVTGVPKLNRPELEAACEDFSNIICAFPFCTLFKGTLSSGVEICVVSTSVKSVMDWSEQSELYFRKKIDTLSRVNHKNFVNLIGYCEENEPFMRMMVFEYSPNGTLFDHLHVKEYEHLNWSVRMRIIMGMAYCLQYMHDELNPPVTLLDLQSTAVFITDDFAAKLVDISLFKETTSCKIISGDNDKDSSKLWDVDPQSNIYSFGMLMLEIISGRLQYSEEGSSIVDWGAKYLDDERTFFSILDPTLKSPNDTELETVCGVIRKCLCRDPTKRPTMEEVATALKEVLGISPEAATPRLSPLWWAELEILSVEAS